MAKKRIKTLFRVLDSMPKGERNLFGEYLAFRPFNASKRLSRLYVLIIKHAVDKGKLELDYAEFVPESEILGSQVEKLASHLQAKLDEFLALRKMQEQPERYQPYVLEAYQDMLPNDALLGKQYRKLAKRIQSAEESLDSHWAMARLDHFHLPFRLAGGEKAPEGFFTRPLERHRSTWLLSQLIYLCATMNEALLLNRPWPEAALEAFEAESEKHPQEGAIWEAYWRVFQIIKARQGGSEQIKEALEFISSVSKRISREHVSDLYNYLLNISFRQIDLGAREFEALVAQIYRMMLELGLLLLSGQLNPHVFKNIVSAHCRIGQTEWCAGFIDQYAPLLPSEHRQFLPQYCKGLLSFYEGRHLDSRRIFRKIIQMDPEGLFWGFESRNLLMKSLYMAYEQLHSSEFSELLRLVASFRMYVHRNARLSDFHKKSYGNFIKYFDRLLKTKETGGMAEVARKSWLDQLGKEKFITHKAWLEEEFRKF